ncbi:MAG: hypothetical protein AB7T37_15170 [Dehalococcoidia bacterium]
MPARQTRRPRRRTVPASSLPRPDAEAGAPGASEEHIEAVSVVEPRARRRHAGPTHHVAQDYRYVRTDLIAVAIVGAISLAFVFGASFLF